MTPSKLDKHIELVEAVNNAKTKQEHREAEIRLETFRDTLRLCGIKPSLMEMDLYYIDKGIERPMCCGVWLDWEPVALLKTYNIKVKECHRWVETAKNANIAASTFIADIEKGSGV